MSSDSKIEKLSKDNFDTWKIQMEAMLTKNDYWGHIDGTTPRPAENDENLQLLSTWIKNDRKAKAEIIIAINPSEVLKKNFFLLI